jgi:uncharacterized protein (TIGR03067 family)
MILLLMLLQPPDPISAEVQKLNGPWVVTSLQVDGKDLSDRMKGYRYVFEGQFMKLQDKNGKPVMRSDNKPDERPFLINVQTNPKTMDMTIAVKSKSFLSLGIYQLKEDELSMCFAEPGGNRPGDFASKPGVTLVVLQRMKSR